MKIKTMMLLLSGLFSIAVHASQTVEIVVPWPPGGGIDFQAQSLAAAAAKLHPNATVKRTYFNACSTAMDHAVQASKSHPTYLLGDIGDIIFHDKSIGSRCPPLKTVPVPVEPVSKLGHVPVVLCHSGKTNLADIQKKKKVLIGYSATTAFTVIGKHMQNDQYQMVPYKATAEAKTALEAGDLDMVWFGGHTALPMMEKEGAKCVAVSSDSKLAGLPSLSKFFGREVPNWDSLVLMFKVGGPVSRPDWLHEVAKSKEFTDALATRRLINGALDKDDLMGYIVRQEKVLLEKK